VNPVNQKILTRDTDLETIGDLTIRVTCVCPPIPLRQFDYCAYIDGHEEETARYGWGFTRPEAIADLLQVLAEERDDDYPDDPIGLRMPEADDEKEAAA
jgi:hypothetical protein